MADRLKRYRETRAEPRLPLYALGDAGRAKVQKASLRISSNAG